MLNAHVKAKINKLSLRLTSARSRFAVQQSSSLANSRVERCHTYDLMPNVPTSCLPPGRVDPEVQGLNVIIECPQPKSSRATYMPPPISRWSKCGGNDTVQHVQRYYLWQFTTNIRVNI